MFVASCWQGGGKLLSSTVKRLVEELIETHGTSDPLTIIENLDIHLDYIPLSTKGVCVVAEGIPIIIINEEYRYHPQHSFILAHELYHAIQHHFYEEYYYAVKDKAEYQADRFAYLLLSHGHEYDNEYDMVRELGIPYEFADRNWKE